MIPRYLHLQPELTPQPLEAAPFRAVIVSDEAVSEGWLHQVAEWIVASGCLYVIAWGVDCEKWHDSVDWAILEVFEFGEIPDERFVMTTWHDEEPASEAYWFAGNCAYHPVVKLNETIILHIAKESRSSELLQAYQDSQLLADDA